MLMSISPRTRPISAMGLVIAVAQVECLGQQKVGDQRAPHKDIAMRKIDQLDNAIDQRIASGNQGINGASGDALFDHL